MLQAPYSTPRLKFSFEESLTPNEEGDSILTGTVIRIMYFYLFVCLFFFYNHIFIINLTVSY